MPYRPMPGEPLPLHPSYISDMTARQFWRVSFRAGRSYQTGLDAEGQALLIQHESESDTAFARRKRSTVPRNYVGPICRRYNDYVFRRAPNIPAEIATESIVADVDGYGTSMADFMRKRLLSSQVDRESYILVDSTAPQAMERTRAQAQIDGDRIIWRPVDADRVVWWYEKNGELVAAVYLDVIDDSPVAIYVDGEMRQVIYLREDKGKTVASVDEPMPHGWGAMPLVRLRPTFDELGGIALESQASPIAEGQRIIYNFLGLLSEELFANTYTQWVASGVSKEDAEAAGVQFGAKRLFCVPQVGADISRIGSDVAQAQSLRDSIADEQDAIWRSAGVDTATGVSAPESGVARAFKHADLSATLASLAAATQEAWLKCMSLSGYDVAPTLSTDYEPSDLASELTALASALAIRLPPVLHEHLTRRFASRNLALSDDEEEELDAQITMPALPQVPQPFGRMAPPPGMGEG